MKGTFSKSERFRQKGDKKLLDYKITPNFLITFILSYEICVLKPNFNLKIIQKQNGISLINFKKKEKSQINSEKCEHIIDMC